MTPLPLSLALCTLAHGVELEPGHVPLHTLSQAANHPHPLRRKRTPMIRHSSAVLIRSCTEYPGSTRKATGVP